MTEKEGNNSAEGHRQGDSHQQQTTGSGEVRGSSSCNTAANGTAADPVSPVKIRPSNAVSDNDDEDDDDINHHSDDQEDDKKETGTDATAESGPEENRKSKGSSPTPVVSSTKKSRPPYKYDPNKITLRFLFANRDGLTVTIDCEPSDTVGEVKGALLSVWPEDLPDCSGGDRLRLVCMGKGYLMPDTRTLEDCQIPVFKTHPTPVNVSVAPQVNSPEETATKKHKHKEETGGSGSRTTNLPANATQVSQGCNCVII